MNVDVEQVVTLLLEAEGCDRTIERLKDRIRDYESKSYRLKEEAKALLPNDNTERFYTYPIDGKPTHILIKQLNRTPLLVRVESVNIGDNK